MWATSKPPRNKTANTAKTLKTISAIGSLKRGWRKLNARILRLLLDGGAWEVKKNMAKSRMTLPIFSYRFQQVFAFPSSKG